MHEKCYIFGKKEKIHLKNQSWLTQDHLKITKYKHPVSFKPVLRIIRSIFENIQ